MAPIIELKQRTHFQAPCKEFIVFDEAIAAFIDVLLVFECCCNAQYGCEPDEWGEEAIF